MTTKEIFVEMDEYIDSIKARIDENAEVTISGCGQSMYPFIDEDKDKIVLEKIRLDRIRVGEIYLYRRNSGRYSIHRVFSMDKECVAMLGDAQLFIERNIKKENLIAVVNRVIKPDREIDCLACGEVFRQAVKMKCRIYGKQVIFFIRRVLSKGKKFSIGVMNLFRKND